MVATPTSVGRQDASTASPFSTRYWAQVVPLAFYTHLGIFWEYKWRTLRD